LIIRPKNWEKFQHYKDRRPPWIRLYHSLLDDRAFWALKGEDAKCLVAIWLIASESETGDLPPVEDLAFRLRLAPKKASELLDRLRAWIVYDASKVLAKVEQPATPETEADKRQTAEAEISPSMVASAVMQETRISGRNLRIVLEEISRNEMVAGKSADEVRDSMITAYQNFQLAKPNLQFVKGLEKFFGEGDWRDQTTWPWKEKRTENPQLAAEWADFQRLEAQ